MRRVAVVAFCLVVPSIVAAQPPRRVEMAAGVRWSGGSDLATEPSVQLKTGGTRPVFRTSTTLDAALGVEGRVGYRLTPRLQVEGAFLFMPTDVTTHVSGDVEGAADTNATVAIREYVAKAGLSYDLRRSRRGRIMPVLLAGGGYLRQVSRGNLLAATGRAYYVGLGVDVAGGARRATTPPRFGWRLDVAAVAAQRGLAATSGLRFRPSVSASLYSRF